LNPRQLSAISLLAALGAVTRIGLGKVALVVPLDIYGVLIKVGLTETLAFVAGFALGPLQGFLTGSLIIVVSDMFMMPGIWTPFIAAIIGLIGIIGGFLRRLANKPSRLFLSLSAISLTLTSEFLQNAWFALFFQIPLMPTLLTGLPSIVTALVNNTILFTALGNKMVRMVREVASQPKGG